MRSLGKNKVQVVHSHRSAVDDRQANVRKQFDDALNVDMAVPVKMCQQARVLFSSKVDGEHTSARFQHARDLVRATFAGRPGQMVKHQRAQHNVESMVGIGQLFSGCQLEHDVDASFVRLSVRSGDHRGRRIDAVNRSG